MEEIEPHETLPTSLGQVLYIQMREIEMAIEDKYQSVRSVDEARMDALTFASSQLGFSKYEAYTYKVRGEDSSISDESARRWEEAIDGVMNGDWTKMKVALQNEARTALEAARFELADNSIMGENLAEGEERLADVYINLIRSIDA